MKDYNYFNFKHLSIAITNDFINENKYKNYNKLLLKLDINLILKIKC